MAAYEVRLYYRFGIVAYINGIEVYRDNMPSGTITTTTLSTGTYAFTEYRSFIRPGNEIDRTISTLAVEVHFPTTSGQSNVNFDAFLAIYASSTKSTEQNCYVYPYNIALSSSSGYDISNIFDFSKDTSFYSKVVPTSVTYAANAIKPYVNGIRVWPNYLPDASPASFTLQGSNASDSWTDIFAASNVVYKSRSFTTMNSKAKSGVFSKYRLQVNSSSTGSLYGYEIQPVVCSE